MSSLNVVSSNIDHLLREGFTQFQKDANFVDMVIAADGCFKKVHRSIIALSSPYLAELINAMPSNSPVLYLYGVKHQIFTYLVQYIYSGHVEVPIEAMTEFLQIVKQLQIKGLENVLNSQNVKLNNESKFVNNEQDQLTDHVSNSGLMDVDILNCDNGVVEITIPEAAHKYNNMVNFEQVIDQPPPPPLVLPDTSCDLSNTSDILNSISGYNFSQSNTTEEQATSELFIPHINLNAEGGFSLTQITPHPEPPSNSCVKQNGTTTTTDTENLCKVTLEVGELKYSVSSTARSVNLVHKGYTFYAHNTYLKTNRKRWRCTSYRRKTCGATIDTEGDFITGYVNHNHEISTRRRKYETLYDTYEDALRFITGDTESVISSHSEPGSDDE